MRILLFTGKGGVGKTTVAAATAVSTAAAGLRTLILSTDPAHSLGDAFDVELGDQPTEVADGLWGGELDYTSGDCTAKYKVVAISPLVSCATMDGKADPHLCVAEPDPSSGFQGSGLSPDIEVMCHPDLLLCVPAKSFPSLKKK